MVSFEIPNSSVVKSTARAALKGRWVEAIIVSCLGMFSIFIIQLIFSAISMYAGRALMYILSAVSIAFFIFLIAPLFLGIIRYFWRLTDSAKDDVSAVFYYFGSKKRYFRAVKLTFVLGWRVLGAIVLCMLPFAVTHMLSGTWVYSVLGQEVPIWAANFMFIEVFFFIIGVLCSILFVSRYYLAPVIAAMDEDLLLLEAIHISSMVSRRSGSAFISLAVSLFGWILLGALCLPVLYTLPFMIACYVIHARFAMVNYNLVLDYYENNMSGSY